MAADVRSADQARRFAAQPARLALVGAGHLAESLVAGWLAAGMEPSAVSVTNRERDDRLARFAAMGLRAERDKARALDGAQVVVLAVRPVDVDAALAECGPVWPGGAVLLSLVAGVPTARLSAHLPPATEVVRAMPNTASAVGESATAAWTRAAAPARAAADALLSVIGGPVVWLTHEADMDAVTALSGSGPAYVYLLIEAMVEAAVAEGLAVDAATDLAVQTVIGAARHLRDSGEGAAELRRRVTSPGGTTAAAMSVLEARGFRPALAEAVQTAARRSRQLGRA